MNSYEQSKDILQRLRRIHRALKDLYTDLRAATRRERMSLLLETLIRHEEHIEATLEQSKHDAPEGALETWHQYVDDLELPDVEERVSELHDEDDLLEFALEVEERLVTFYDSMATSSRVETVKALFRDLYELENEKKKLLVRGAAELKDL